MVSDTKYLLTNTGLYDTYFEWTIDTVNHYIKNNVSYPLIIRFHPGSSHPGHKWSFYVLLKHLNKIKFFQDYLSEKKIILDMPWDSSGHKPSYSVNDIFITYQGSAVLELAASGIKSISMNSLFLNKDITYIPPSLNFYTSRLITDKFISSYSAHLPKQMQLHAGNIYAKYVNLTNARTGKAKRWSHLRLIFKQWKQFGLEATKLVEQLGAKGPDFA